MEIMFELHIANKNYSSWSLRPWLLMKALAIPFTETIHPFAASGSAGDFINISPSAKLPMLTHGPLRIWDSYAITEYLAELHPEVWPVSRVQRAWARSACAEMHAGFVTLRTQCSMNIGVRICLHDINEELQADLSRLEQLWAQGLNQFQGPWLAGDKFTAVDAFFAPVAFRLQTYGIELQQPAQSYAQRLLDHPAMMQWQEQALQENLRDEPHEAMSQKFGKVTQDLRTTLKT